MTVDVAKSDTQDAETVYSLFWNRTIHDQSGEETLTLLDGIQSRVHELEKEVKKSGNSDDPMVQRSLERAREELRESRRLQRICQDHLRDLQKQHRAMGNAEVEVQRLRQQGRHIWFETEVLLGQIEEKVRDYIGLQSRYRKIRAQFEFTKTNPKPDQFPPDLELGADIKLLIHDRIGKISSHQSPKS